MNKRKQHWCTGVSKICFEVGGWLWKSRRLRQSRATRKLGVTRAAGYIQLSCWQLTACFETTGRRVSIQYGSLIKLSANLASAMYNFVKIACNVALIKPLQSHSWHNMSFWTKKEYLWLCSNWTKTLFVYLIWSIDC